MAIVEERSRGHIVSGAVRTFILVVAAFSCLFPLWYTFCMSISSKAAVEAGFVTVYPIGFTWDNYRAIMKDATFYTAFLRSAVRVFVGTPFTLVVSILIAYPLSKDTKSFRLRNVIMWVLVFCMFFSGGTMPWYLFMVKYNLMDSMMGLIVCGGLPIYNCILIMNAFRTLPKEMEEAAMIDGANPWRTLFSVAMPCVIPTVATISLFVAVAYWNDYFQGMVLSKKLESYPLMTYIRIFNANIDMNANLTAEQMQSKAMMSNRALNAAKVFIALIPMLAVYPWIQRYFISGIMIGAVKG